LLLPTSGRAVVAGHDVAVDPEGVKASIGYMSQKFSLYLDLPVIENLLFFGGAYGFSGRALRQRAEQALALTELVGFENTTTGDLPGGVRQRLALSCALLHEPRIVFLDEPTAGVDPVQRRAFWRLIRTLSSGGTTVFVTTHYLDEAEYCGRIGLMVDGRLVALDTPASLKERYVPDRVLVARGTGLGRASEVLRDTPGIRHVAPFGAGLHLRVDPALFTGAAIAQILVGAGAGDVVVEPSEPTLEDVFLEVAREAAPPEVAA
jgi:ABC-2 type transport system ATP-binding protein